MMKGIMNMNNKRISDIEALLRALEEAGLDADEAWDFSAKLDAGLYSLRFRTDWLSYECFVAAESGELLGMNFAPSDDPGYDRSELDEAVSQLLWDYMAA